MAALSPPGPDRLVDKDRELGLVARLVGIVTAYYRVGEGGYVGD